MNEATEGHRFECTHCGSTRFVVTGVMVPSATKIPAKFGQVEADYVLRCENCWNKLVVSEVPPWYLT